MKIYILITEIKYEGIQTIAIYDDLRVARKIAHKEMERYDYAYILDHKIGSGEVDLTVNSLDISMKKAK